MTDIDAAAGYIAKFNADSYHSAIGALIAACAGMDDRLVAAEERIAALTARLERLDDRVWSVEMRPSGETYYGIP